MAIRTDLAEEAHSLWEKSAGTTTKLPGVKARQWTENGVAHHEVIILDAAGEKALGKPRGRYETIWVSRDGRPTPEVIEALGAVLSRMLRLDPEESLLVVGLGNRAMTPDAVGPLTLRGLVITRHLREHLPRIFSDLPSVSALEPGVLGTTGMESAQIVQSIVNATKPDRVLVVDALAAGESDRLCTVVQVTDAGIVPGSGVGNSRAAFSENTLGVPVIAVGVPTVMDAGTKDAPLLVTDRDIDAKVRRLSSLISAGIHRAIFPQWTTEEIAQFVD